MSAYLIRAQRLYEKTETAYSYDRYRDWKSVCKAMLMAGYTEKQSEAILCSKWMRWAADASGQDYGRVTAKAAIQYVKKMSLKDVEALTVEHFANRGEDYV